MDLSLALSAIATLISGAALYVSIKQPLRTQRLSVAQVAAAAIIESVGTMREAVWGSAANQPDPEAVAKLACDLDRTCRAHRRSLPRGLSGVGGQVRAAVVNYLGGASGYALDPGLSGLPFSGHERYWWDISTTYLDYVVDTLGQWRNHPQVRRVELIPFHEWRRDEDERYYALRMSKAGPAPELFPAATLSWPARAMRRQPRLSTLALERRPPLSLSTPRCSRSTTSGSAAMVRALTDERISGSHVPPHVTQGGLIKPIELEPPELAL